MSGRQSESTGAARHKGEPQATAESAEPTRSHDVSEQKRGEESRQNTVLLREIHNRVKSHLRLIRSFPEGNQRSLDAAEKLGPQAVALLFVPAVRTSQIGLGFRADKEAVRFHALALILWTTSSHGEPEDGFLW